jgi:ethanolamine utilization protein EutN
MVGMKLLIVQPLDENQNDAGACIVAADGVYQAGLGDVVYFVASREAAEAMEPRFVPVDHAIVGIVDATEVRS